MDAERNLTAIGLMSGTSFDGIDVAVLVSDGRGITRQGPSLDIPYSASDRQILGAAMEAAGKVLTPTEQVPPAVQDAEALVSQRHINAVMQLLAVFELKASDIDLIGFHGQTVIHRPEIHWTWQIGDAGALARATGIDTVADLRLADVANGGEGAPLAPIYHAALAADLADESFPLLVLNLGGVGNVTWLADRKSILCPERLIAFDTGPANALIDDWVASQSDLSYDLDGRLAASGAVDQKALDALMDNDFFERSPPKSLDRNSFSAAPVKNLTLEDGAATLTAFTVSAIVAALQQLPVVPKTCVVTGGGRRNPFLLQQLRQQFSAEIRSAEDVGWRGDALEAEAFAFMAIRSKKGLPNSFPGTTGVPAACVGGKLYPAKA